MSRRNTESKALSRAREWAAGRIKQLGLATKSGFVGTGGVNHESLSTGYNSGQNGGRKRTMDSSLGSGITIPPPTKRQRRSGVEAIAPPPKGSGLKKRGIPSTIKKERVVTQKTVSKGENTFQIYRERNQAILATLDLKGDDKITFSTTAKFLKISSQHRPLCMVVGCTKQAQTNSYGCCYKHGNLLSKAGKKKKGGKKAAQSIKKKSPQKLSPVKKVTAAKKKSPQKQSPKKTVQSTQFDHTTTTDRDKTFPAEPAEGFPKKWTIRRISRLSNDKKRDLIWFSPKLGLRFKSRRDALAYVDVLKRCRGDEAKAIEKFKSK